MKRKLGRKVGHRQSMLKNLAISFLLYEKITTTEAKAKQVRPIIEQAINIAKNNDFNSSRKLLSMFMHNKNVVNKLHKDIIKRYQNTSCGYIRMYKTKPRLGDNSPQVILILSKSKFLNNLDKKKDSKKPKNK